MDSCFLRLCGQRKQVELASPPLVVLFVFLFSINDCSEYGF